MGRCTWVESGADGMTTCKRVPKSRRFFLQNLNDLLYNGSRFIVMKETIKLFFTQTRIRKKVEYCCINKKTFYDTRNLC